MNLFSTQVGTKSELRAYQSDSVNAALEHKHGIIVAPTGSGKSHIIAEIVNQIDGKSLILQPTKEILESNYDKITALGFPDAAIYSASMGIKKTGRATYATIGSIIKKLDLFSDIKCLIVDECHYVNPKGGMYEALIKALNPEYLIGLTATPYRLHTTSMGSDIRLLIRTRPRIFTKFLHVTECSDLIDAGFLRQPEYIVSDPGDKSILKENSTGADYTDDSISKYLEAISETDRICMAALDALQRGQEHLLVFTPYLANAADAVGALRGEGISANMVSGTSPKKEREEKLAKFRSGEIYAMVNVGVLTTGYDFPALDTIIASRPTKSLSLYYQIIGRSVRPYPDKKRVLVYDLVDNFSVFGDPMQMKLRPDSTGNYVLFSDEGRRLTGRSPRESRGAKEAENCEVTFGKHKGKMLHDMPLGYMVFCVREFDEGKWKDVFRNEIKRRKILEHTTGI